MTTRFRGLAAAVLGFAYALAAQAQIPLQQSTASQIVMLGPFIDETDGKTAKTALTIANTDVKLSKNGAAIGNKNSGGCTHDSDGWYACTLDATDTNTAGRLTVKLHVSTSLPVFREYMVYPTALYAAQFSTAPGANGGFVLVGTNAATVFNGTAAVGATPATAGLTLNGGAASTTGGGVAAPGLASTGGAGAASTNGAAAGIASTGGGTTTVTGGAGFALTGTGNLSGLASTGAGTGHGAVLTSGAGATGNALQLTAASTNGNAFGVTPTGTGLVFSTAANANVTQFGGVAGTFSSGRAESNMTHIAGAIVAAGTAQLGVNVVNFGGNAGTFASGRPEVNATHWSGTILATADTAGYPKVTIKNGTGAGELSFTSGVVVANMTQIASATVNTATAQLGVNVVNAGGTVWNSGAITANTFTSNSITAAKVASDVGPQIMASLPTGNGPFPGLGIIDLGTAQTADAVSITLRAGFSAHAVNMVGVSVHLYGATNGLFARCVSTAYNDTTKVLTCTGLGEAPTGTVNYVVYATAGSALGAEVIEPNGGITRKCIEAVALAYMAGTVSTSAGTSTYKDPSNTTTRIVGTVSGSNRGTITITCPP